MNTYSPLMDDRTYHCTTITVGGINQPLTARALMLAWADGLEVGLWDNARNCRRYGLIVAIALESGYGEGQKPRHFLVSLRGQPYPIYARAV